TLLGLVLRHTSSWKPVAVMTSPRRASSYCTELALGCCSRFVLYYGTWVSRTVWRPPRRPFYPSPAQFAFAGAAPLRWTAVPGSFLFWGPLAASVRLPNRPGWHSSARRCTSAAT